MIVFQSLLRASLLLCSFSSMFLIAASQQSNICLIDSGSVGSSKAVPLVFICCCKRSSLETESRPYNKEM